jgi:Arc/MetJ-type ribon-helix-helix transcriptional regulator
MPDDVDVTVSLNQQQLQLVERLVREGQFGDTLAAVFRRVLQLYAAEHRELFVDNSPS